MAGRPSSYTEEVAAEICALIIEGEILSKICKRDDMPALRTVQVWLRDRRDFAELYDRAKHDRYDTWADLLVEIASDKSEDWIEKERPDGSTFTTFNAEHVQRSKLRVDTLKWLMAKGAPRQYGERLDLNHSGKVEIDAQPDFSGLTNDELAVMKLLLLKGARGSEHAAAGDALEYYPPA